MKLALECRTDLLEMVQPFADFDWILVDRYKADEAYASWYQKSTNLKFVDNSVTEQGEPCSVEDLIEVALDCNAMCIIAPDWINDKKKTLEGYEQCVKALSEQKDLKVIGVLQGSDPLEALSCLDTYEGNTVCVPYRVGGSAKGDANWLMALRRALVVSRIPSNRYIHLLGYTSSDEFPWYKAMDNVMSVDTDVPIRAGLASQDTDDFDRKRDVSTTPLTKDNWAGICRNLALVRKYIS